ncbi:carboxypeptidase regulatory-like domain-containing protein [Actinotalea sp. M2MS4P-6]|uniref:MSCRAMM family protein n=1 Tax=Actinotalea sp. M2MS4P-6 TaxID=2983762 RepID=UPI0021E4E86B|nr:carboxypeptidase regulatory-like domain-containing protein [Actinotalea sp. M2MS4P-6]MCV2394055.1 carboxypeptidase regulatory-like domain-containing protein [Actinotalea sp. M2MS4P-6]
MRGKTMRGIHRAPVRSLRTRGAAVVALVALALMAGAGCDARLLPPLTGEVGGVVTMDSDRVRGVVVDVLAAGGGVVGSATTNAAGRFSVTRVPLGDVELRATSHGQVTWYDRAADRSDATVLTVRKGRPLSVDFALLPATAAVTGEVLGWMDPLGGATVTVYDAATDEPITSVELGEYQSSYLITGLPPGDVKVGATRDGWLPGFANGVRTLADATVYTLEPGQTLTQSWDPMVLYIDLTPMSTLMGWVHGVRDDPELGWDGPLPDATVSLLGTETGEALATTRTDELGNFRFDGLAPGTYTLRAEKDGWLPIYVGQVDNVADAAPFTFYGGEVQSTGMTLYAEPAITGEVLGNFDPLGGATVTVYDAATDEPITSVQLGEYETTYRIEGLMPGEVKVGATKDGWLPGFADGVRTLADATVYTLEPGQTLSQSWDPIVLYVDLTPMSTLMGEVLGIRDDPVYGWDDPLRGVTVTLLDATTGATVATTQTDELGDFRFDGVAPGGYTLLAEKDGWLPVYAGQADDLADAATFTFVGGEVQATGLTIYAEPAVTGEVLGNFDPLGGATVTVYDAATGEPIASVQLGEYETTYRIEGLTPGEVKVGAAKDGWLPCFAEGARTLADATVYTLQPGQTLSQSWDSGVLYIDLMLMPRLYGEVTGIRDDPVDGWDGPLPGVTVSLLALPGGDVAATTLTDAYGAYRFSEIPPGTYTVLAEKDGWLPMYAGQSDTLADAQTFTLSGAEAAWLETTLYARPAVAGQVLGWMDPLGGATVTVYDAASGDVLAQTVADGDGHYRVEGLMPGDVKVGATHDGWSPGFADGVGTLAAATVFTLVPGRTLVQSWDPMVLYIDLTPGGTLRGNVFGFKDHPNDPWDDPLGGVTITLLDRGSGAELATATTDTFGDFAFAGLTPGSYTVRADKDGWLTVYAGQTDTFADAATIVLVDGETQAVGLTMYGEPAVQGQVLGEFDPLGGATVTVYDAASGAPLGETVADGDGYYLVDGLQPGDVKVGAVKDGWLPGFADGASTWETATVFTLVPGGVLRQSWDPMVLYLDLTPVP